MDEPRKEPQLRGLYGKVKIPVKVLDTVIIVGFVALALVLLLQIIFAGLNFLSVDANYLYIVKGLIILIACSIDMRKYLVRK